jgi:hypothetical protein
MGTRNLIAVYKDGEYKVAQYGQWDGYPSGQGVSILDYLKEYGTNRIKTKLNKVRWITDDEYKKQWLEFGHDIDSSDGFVSCDLADKFDKKYPELSRDTGADILSLIAETDDVLKIRNSIDFAGDSLFCEWAYVIDFDKNTFEVYEGFNQKPIDVSERFYDYYDKDQDHRAEQYYPVTLKATFDLNNLPSKETFLSICKPKEDAE